MSNLIENRANDMKRFFIGIKYTWPLTYEEILYFISNLENAN